MYLCIDGNLCYKLGFHFLWLFVALLFQWFVCRQWNPKRFIQIRFRVYSIGNKTYLLLCISDQFYSALTLSQKEFIINQRPLLNESLHDVVFFVSLHGNVFFYSSYNFRNEKSPHLLISKLCAHSTDVYSYTPYYTCTAHPFRSMCLQIYFLCENCH